MTLGYLPRVISISLASYFLVHVFAGTAVSLAAGRAVRWAGRFDPWTAGRWLFTMRLAPAVGGLLAVVCLCLPSYIALEPSGVTESIGFGCLAAACGGALLWMCSLVRAVRGVARSARFVEAGRGPLLALSGILRPRLVMSRDVRRVLSREELAVALRHERAHAASRDNLKHFSMLAAPAVLPFGGASVSLERVWQKYAEWAADDCAVAGDRRRPVALASALVRAARHSCGMPSPSLVLPLSGDDQQLAARVERLLSPARAVRPAHSSALPVAAALLAAGALAAIFQPAVLMAVHRVLERLIE